MNAFHVGFRFVDKPSPEELRRLKSARRRGLAPRSPKVTEGKAAKTSSSAPAPRSAKEQVPTLKLQSPKAHAERSPRTAKPPSLLAHDPATAAEDPPVFYRPHAGSNLPVSPPWQQQKPRASRPSHEARTEAVSGAKSSRVAGLDRLKSARETQGADDSRTPRPSSPVHLPTSPTTRLRRRHESIQGRTRPATAQAARFCGESPSCGAWNNGTTPPDWSTNLAEKDMAQPHVRPGGGGGGSPSSATSRPQSAHCRQGNVVGQRRASPGVRPHAANIKLQGGRPGGAGDGPSPRHPMVTGTHRKCAIPGKVCFGKAVMSDADKEQQQRADQAAGFDLSTTLDEQRTNYDRRLRRSGPPIERCQRAADNYAPPKKIHHAYMTTTTAVSWPPARH